MQVTIQQPSLFHPYDPHLVNETYLDNSPALASDTSTVGNSIATISTSTYTRSETAVKRECIMFPTYARRHPQNNSEWLVQSKGWAVSHGSTTGPRDKLVMGITKNFAGQSSADLLANKLYQERFKYFLTKNKRNKPFVIRALGTVSFGQYLASRAENRGVWPDDAKDTAETLDAATNKPFFSNTRRTSTEASYHSIDNADKSNAVPSCSNRGIAACTPNSDEYSTVIDQLLVSRPANPLSTILDGIRRFPRTHSSSSIPSMSSDDSDDSSHSPSMSEHDRHKVSVKTENNGRFHSNLVIPHSQVVEWAKLQDHCNARLICLRSDADTFASSFGIVNLVEPRGISIISDIDDTIKDTNILAGPRTVVANTFFKETKAVEGMAETYMRWYGQGASFHYVSNSPFQLMRMLEDFLKQHGFPPGSMHLRLDGSLLARLVEVPGRAKRDAILQIIHDFPERQFILIGDSGEIDLEIYARIAAEHPGRIIKILIRDVSSEKPPRRNTFTALLKRSKSAQTSATQEQIDGFRGSKSLADLTQPPLMNLESRVRKARKQAGVQIILFRSAETIRSDKVITKALWNALDDISATV